MTDSVVRALLNGPNLQVTTVVASNTALDAQRRHELKPASSSLFAQGLVGGTLMASLQKGETRINLQLECDGPFRGFLVDAAASGEVRGYVKNPAFDMELGEGAFQWRAALGNAGFISVLRDNGNGYYRSSVELLTMRLSDDLNHYFATSDQTATKVAITVQAARGEHVGKVAGVLIQVLPGGDERALKKLGSDLEADLAAYVAGQGEPTADGLLRALFPQAEVIGTTPIRFACSCSHDRAMNTIASLGADDVQNIVDTMGSTAVTCHFCGTKHEITLPDLWSILELLGRPQQPN